MSEQFHEGELHPWRQAVDEPKTQSTCCPACQKGFHDKLKSSNEEGRALWPTLRDANLHTLPMYMHRTEFHVHAHTMQLSGDHLYETVWHTSGKQGLIDKPPS